MKLSSRTGKKKLNGRRHNWMAMPPAKPNTRDSTKTLFAVLFLISVEFSVLKIAYARVKAI